MTTLRLALATAGAAAVAALAGAGAAAAQTFEEIQRGDTGEAVELWQDHLGEWLAYARPALAIADPRGTFGPGTEAATRELQRFVGIDAHGRVDQTTWLNLYDRTAARATVLLGRSDAVVPAWPIPLPRWYWSWAEWYLGRGEHAGHARDPRTRPAAAPARIPEWGWRRMLATNGASLEEQAIRLVEDRVRAIFGEQLRRPASFGTSAVAGGWALAGGSLLGHDQGDVVAWLRLVQGRWVPWNLGRWFPEEPDRPQVQPDPRFVPCDLRPAGPESRC